MEAQLHENPAAIHWQLGAIFVSLELSRSKWLITSLSPGGGEKMPKHMIVASDLAGLFSLLQGLRGKARERTGMDYPVIAIQEAGLDGFWIHRSLEAAGVESHVVAPASIAVSRHRRRVKTDRIDGEALLRALMAYKRGEPRVCAMVRAPTPRDEDRRRLIRERKTLVTERTLHVNRIKGLLFSQGIGDYEPRHRDRHTSLATLTTGDGRPLPPHLRALIERELERLELVMEQIRKIEVERDAMIEEEKADAPTPPPVMLRTLKGIGPEFAAVLWSEGLFRQFDNRRQVAAYAGLAPTPWQSGMINHDQGVSKAGNPRLRTTMIQIAWLWLRHQSDSSLSRWFQQRVTLNGGRQKQRAIVALARKLLVALLKFVTAGVVIEGAVMSKP
ncbi:IS110 family transposase [Sphingomonas sp. NFX23]